MHWHIVRITSTPQGSALQYLVDGTENVDSATLIRALRRNGVQATSSKVRAAHPTYGNSTYMHCIQFFNDTETTEIYTRRQRQM
eukprot:5852677-Prorocentrum_lima.AAC.1